MKLHITRPIVFFDLETTGTNVAKDHIVELCYIKLYPNGDEETRSMRIKPIDSIGNVIHIPEETSAIHGIHDEDVKDCPSFKDVASSLLTVFQDSDLAGYNSNYFDIPMLVEEFLRAGINPNISSSKCVDVCVIFKKMEQRTLSAAYKFYCKQNLENAHSALADTKATLEVLEAQLDRYSDTLENDVESLSNFSKVNNNVDYAGRITLDAKNNYVFNFGKYKGKEVKEVLKKDPGYYNWILQGEFTLNTKQVIKKIKMNM